MPSMKQTPRWCGVALLAEGVDRNAQGPIASTKREPSPSSRRAWIEILKMPLSDLIATVALLAEGVDRNIRA